MKCSKTNNRRARHYIPPARALGRGSRSKTSRPFPHKLSTAGLPTLRPLRIWGGECGVDIQGASNLGDLKAMRQRQSS